jgi:hypothetical protein
VSADPLSDVLRAVRANGAFFYAVTLGEGWQLAATFGARPASPYARRGSHLAGVKVGRPRARWLANLTVPGPSTSRSFAGSQVRPLSPPLAPIEAPAGD